MSDTNHEYDYDNDSRFADNDNGKCKGNFSGFVALIVPKNSKRIKKCIKIKVRHKFNLNRKWDR